jgi:hypothetical protein
MNKKSLVALVLAILAGTSNHATAASIAQDVAGKIYIIGLAVETDYIVEYTGPKTSTKKWSGCKTVRILNTPKHPFDASSITGYKVINITRFPKCRGDVYLNTNFTGIDDDPTEPTMYLNPRGSVFLYNPNATPGGPTAIKLALAQKHRINSGACGIVRISPKKGLKTGQQIKVGGVTFTIPSPSGNGYSCRKGVLVQRK